MGFGVLLGVGMTVDEAYTRNLREALLNRIKAEDERRKKESREAAFVKLQAPNEWSQLKGWIQDTVGELNEGLPAELIRYAEDRSDLIQIKCRLGRSWRTAVITFHHVAGTMSRIVVGGLLSMDLEFECEPQGQHLSWFMPGDHHHGYSILELGKKILSEATSELEI
jgi:hypothetical protein